jgi:ABC-type multidrug transport system fused ATPase/permease subunit
MAGYRVLKGIRAEDEAALRYRRASRRALASTLRARRAEGAFVGSVSLATGLFLTAVAVAAGLLATDGALGLAELVTVIGLTQFLIAPLQSLARNAGGIWISGVASAARVLELLRGDADGPDLPRGASVEIEHAADVLAHGDPEIVAVSADGLAARDLLARLRERRPDALVVPHEAHLFAGSVWDNVALPGVRPERAEAALAQAHCQDFATTLPQGWDTSVGEGGAALSGGQRQRVALARALAQDAPLLVLHDPTTAVGAVTEASIARRLREARTGGRTVVVTRSPALLQIADRVLSIDGAGPS